MDDNLGRPVEGPECGVIELLLSSRVRAGSRPQLHGIRCDLELLDAPAECRSNADAEENDRDGIVRAEDAPTGEDLETSNV